MGTEYITFVPKLLTFAVDSVILVATVLTSLQAFTKHNPLVKIRDWVVKPVEDNMEHLKLEMREIKDQQLKIMICSKDIPKSERVAAGYEYVEKRGLNGEVKIKYKILKEEYETELKNKGGKL